MLNHSSGIVAYSLVEPEATVVGGVVAGATSPCGVVVADVAEVGRYQQFPSISMELSPLVLLVLGEVQISKARPPWGVVGLLMPLSMELTDALDSGVMGSCLELGGAPLANVQFFRRRTPQLDADGLRPSGSGGLRVQSLPRRMHRRQEGFVGGSNAHRTLAWRHWSQALRSDILVMTASRSLVGLTASCCTFCNKYQLVGGPE